MATLEETLARFGVDSRFNAGAVAAELRQLRDREMPGVPDSALNSAIEAAAKSYLDDYMRSAEQGGMSWGDAVSYQQLGTPWSVATAKEDIATSVLSDYLRLVGKPAEAQALRNELTDYASTGQAKASKNYSENLSSHRGGDFMFDTGIPLLMSGLAGGFGSGLLDGGGAFGAGGELLGGAESLSGAGAWTDFLGGASAAEAGLGAGVGGASTFGGIGETMANGAGTADWWFDPGNNIPWEQAPAPVEEAIRKTPGLIGKINQTFGTNFGISDAAGAGNVLRQVAGMASGGDSSALGWLRDLALPAALVAGLFENNKNPLTGNVTEASNRALASAGAFGAMPSAGMQPSSAKAIALANSSAGAWQPYVDKAAAYTNEAAGGIPSIDLSTYMNPYLDSVLSPAIRDIEEAATRRRQQMKHLATVSGNDTYTPGSTNSTRYGVESGLIDQNTLRSIGDVSANARRGAFDTATSLASSDLNRKGSAGGAFNTLANTVGTQGGADITRLAGAGDLEARPQENALTHAADTTKLYSSIIPGTTSAITATNQPSILGQAVGAFGAYNAATQPGGIWGPPKP